MTTPRVDPDRRRFLRAAAAGSALAALGPLRRALAAADDDAQAPALVLIALAGGNDGLSTVVPYADDAYARNRRATRIAPDEVLRLDDRVGLHPALRALRGRYDRGELAIVPGCGYPGASRSHFRSMDVWQAGDLRGRAAGSGWIGRACERAFGDDAHPTRLVHVGGAPPLALASRVHRAACFAVPAAYRFVAAEDALARTAARVEEAAAPAHDRLAFLRATHADARASSSAVRAAAAAYRPAVAYPDDAFARSLKDAAAMLCGGLGTRAVSVALGGFDTHAGQRSPHDALLGRLDAALGAFLADLDAHGRARRTTVLVFSEFGRRVRENGSRGTDHGAAGPVLCAGGAVRGGLHGAHPALDDLEQGDLAFTVDFRSVYADLIEWAFSVPAGDVLGLDPPRLGLVRRA